MNLDPEIRDQAYQFFIEEAPELLEAIETGLLTLQTDSSPAQLHNIMRAAHSIKGGAASVELNGIKSLAHRLETIFKALYSDQVVLDAALENKLLRAYDCLRLPLESQIDTDSYDEEKALTTAEPIFQEIESLLGPALAQADNFIPTSSDLGIDMVSSIFEIDVQQGLERLQRVANEPDNHELIGELRAQTEVFSGFAELLGLPGFGKICEAANQAANAAPDKIITVLQQTILDFAAAREAVLAGDRTQGGNPSEALLAMAGSENSPSFTEAKETLQTVSEVVDNSTLDLIQDEYDLEKIFAEEENQATINNLLEEDNEAIITDISGNLNADLLQQEYDLETIFAEEKTQATIGSLLPEENETSQTESEVAADSTPDLHQEEYDLETIFSQEKKQGKLDSFAALAECEGLLSTLAQDNPLAPSTNITQDATETQKRVSAIKNISSGANHLSSLAEEVDSASHPLPKNETLTNLDTVLQSVEDSYETLPIATELPGPIAIANQVNEVPAPADKTPSSPTIPRQTSQQKSQTGKTLTARIALEHLERMDNCVGELAINRNSLSLQNEQFQRTVRYLKQRFAIFRGLAKQLQGLSDKILINPDRVNGDNISLLNSTPSFDIQGSKSSSSLLSEAQFDSLELDTYNAANILLEELLEELLQVEESIEDINLFAGQSNQKLEKQRQLLTQLRDELMWSRMVPLSGVLNRFPRVLRELSSTHKKPVELKLTGTSVLVDRVMLEKLYDPLLHLLRNGFDHGIEPLEERIKQGKSAQGTIEIRAYHQGNSTFIEVRDDGRGLDLDRISQRAIEVGFLTESDLPNVRKQQLYNVLFEPGFSTTTQVSELSGRGVGLDVVRERLQSFNGKVSVTSELGQGTTFVLRIPLTLTLAKLIIARVGAALIAIPSDGVEEILTPLEGQIKESAGQKFLFWRKQLVSIHSLEALLSYSCYIPEKSDHDFLNIISSHSQLKKPLLVIRRDDEVLTLEVDQIITEQELVIKPFSKSIAAPRYMNGCTFLGDGRLVPVLDGIEVIEHQSNATPQIIHNPQNTRSERARSQSPNLLIIDDSSALRRTLALSLQKAGYRVMQAKDGREALDYLQQGHKIQLIVCDIEMPRMNGFEFLSQRRLNPKFANIPTIMLTSRSSQKHQRLAFQLGAADYFSKPYIEADFLSALKTHLKAQSTPILAT